MSNKAGRTPGTKNTGRFLTTVSSREYWTQDKFLKSDEIVYKCLVDAEVPLKEKLKAVELLWRYHKIPVSFDVDLDVNIIDLDDPDALIEEAMDQLKQLKAMNKYSD